MKLLFWSKQLRKLYFPSISLNKQKYRSRLFSLFIIYQRKISAYIVVILNWDMKSLDFTYAIRKESTSVYIEI